jgi:hypothetical protein
MQYKSCYTRGLHRTLIYELLMRCMLGVGLTAVKHCGFVSSGSMPNILQLCPLVAGNIRCCICPCLAGAAGSAAACRAGGALCTEATF